MKQQPDYRPIDPDRVHRIRSVAVPLGLVLLSVLTATGLIYLALGWVSKSPLLAMTFGLHAALVFSAVLVVHAGAAARVVGRLLRIHTIDGAHGRAASAIRSGTAFTFPAPGRRHQAGVNLVLACG